MSAALEIRAALVSQMKMHLSTAEAVAVLGRPIFEAALRADELRPCVGESMRGRKKTRGRPGGACYFSRADVAAVSARVAAGKMPGEGAVR